MTKKRTLYISDLDGTLLRSDQTVSVFTADTIGKLTEKGLLFSYATARSLKTASKVTANLPIKLPVIVFNGSFIMETDTQKRLLSRIFTKEETACVLNKLLQSGIFPIVNAFFGDSEKFSYVCGKETRGVRTFLSQRQDDPRKRSVSHPKELYDGDVFHVACIDEEERLLPAYEYFKNIFPCVLYRDMYTNETWLEIHPKGATKANALLALKEMLGCEKTVCFGDGKNDVPMFMIADESYAVANAEQELKTIASAVIESNEADGVAKWLSANAEF